MRIGNMKDSCEDWKKAAELGDEEVLITKLKKQRFSIAELEGKQNESDYKATKQAMSDGYDFI